MIEQIRALAKQIAALPEAAVDFNTFPSGSAMLDVRRAGRLYVMAYSPDRGFGVDEVGDNDGFLVSYRFSYTQFEPAASRLWQLVTGTTRPSSENDAEEDQTGVADDQSDAAKVKQRLGVDPNRP